MKFLLVYRVERTTLPVSSFSIQSRSPSEAIDYGLKYMRALNKGASFCGLIALNSRAVLAVEELANRISDEPYGVQSLFVDTSDTIDESAGQDPNHPLNAA